MKYVPKLSVIVVPSLIEEGRGKSEASSVCPNVQQYELTTSAYFWKTMLEQYALKRTVGQHEKKFNDDICAVSEVSQSGCAPPPRYVTGIFRSHL